MYNLPADADPLELDGFFAWSDLNPQDGSVRFWLLRQRSVRIAEQMVAVVHIPNIRTVDRWTAPGDLACNIYGQSTTNQDAKGAAMLAKVMELAARFASHVDECNEPALADLREKRDAIEREREERRAEYERERQQRYERLALERAELARRQAELEETFKWYLDQNFKLRRQGYKSTVFGTVKTVEHGVMRTISERGTPMSIKLTDITEFYIRYEGEKKYTKIYTREAANAPS